jgi:murein DD-endopeptidase MepM/ murein hydrolase activator NlpD
MRHRSLITTLVLIVASPAAGIAVAQAAPNGPVTPHVARYAPPLVEMAAPRTLRPVARFKPRPKAAFPVKAPVGYGENAARYGSDRGGRMHEGQDMFAPPGTPLVAMFDSKVVEEGNGGGRGNYVALWSPSAKRTFVYLHMQSPAHVKTGEKVEAGQRVGELGCTGSCFGDHLHLEARSGKGANGAPNDPMPYLSRAKRR